MVPPRAAVSRSAFNNVAYPLLVSLITVSGATLLRRSADSLLLDHLIFSWYLVAVVLATMWAGPLAGTCATLFSVLAADFVFVDPRYSLDLKNPGDDAALALFAIFAGALVWQVSRWKKAVTENANLTIDRRLAEERAMRLHRAVECSGEAVFLTDLDGTITYINPEFTRLYGYTTDEVVGKTTPRILKSGVVPAPVYENFWKTLLTGETMRGELVNRTRDGKLVEIDGSANPIVEADGSVVGFLGVQRDVTGRKHADRRLTRVMAAVESAGDAIGISDAQGHHIYQNAAMSKLFEFETAAELEAAGGGQARVKDPSVAREMFGRIMSGGAWAGELEMVTKSGRVFPAFERANAVKDERGEIVGLIGIITDIAERKVLESQLIQAQKMETVGRLAGGVAHDFNNLLTIILGHAELLLSEADGDTAWRGDVAAIKQAGQSATALTRQLLAFSRKQIVQPRRMDVGEVVARLEKMLGRLIGEDIRCTVSRRDGVPQNISADPGQIEQVVLNLAVNARDAMPNGGTLRIETARVQVDVAFASTRVGLKAGPYIALSVTDTGCGMTPEVRSHLFEPFFTTKERGKGTGLGLATVYGIVSQQGGYINVDTAVGKGSTFTVFLPESQDKAAADRLFAPAPAARPGAETVLVVDDDSAVRGLIARVLSNNGYTVIPAESGEHALRLAEAHTGRIHLLLTDVVMPGMDGPTLYARIRSSRPAIRVLYVSGYTDDALGLHGVIDSKISLLIKPFGHQQLLGCVASVLGAEESEPSWLPGQARP